MARRATQKYDNIAVVNLTRDSLRLLLPMQESGAAKPTVVQRRMVWRLQAADLLSPQGQAELSAAFATLAGREKLQGRDLYLTLSRDFCVTRVVAGENESVRREVKELVARSRGYLTLGVGEKIVAVSEEPIDARRSYSWVTVANRQVLQAIDRAASDARLNLVHVEDSVVSISRVVQAAGIDKDAPVLLLDLANSGVDVGLCYRGQLLLDYRPSGRQAKESADVIINRHTKRLQRYVDRLLKDASRPLATLCLCGSRDDVEHAVHQLEQRSDTVFEQQHVLVPGSISEGWNLDETICDDSELAGPFGLLVSGAEEGRAGRYPNLLDGLRGNRQQPVGRMLLKLGWPVLVTLAASMLLAVGGLLENRHADALAATVEQLAPRRDEVRQLDITAFAARRKVSQLEQVARHAGTPPWNDLLNNVGQSMPRGVWMSQFAVDGAGVVVISGTSHSEDGVFEFVRYLKGIPGLWSVSLERTQATFLSSGPAVTFMLRGAVKDHVDVTSEGLPVSVWHPAPGIQRPGSDGSVFQIARQRTGEVQ